MRCQRALFLSKLFVDYVCAINFIVFLIFYVVSVFDFNNLLTEKYYKNKTWVQYDFCELLDN